VKALVTGANGFLGTALVARLLENGACVRCLVRAGSSRSRLEATLAARDGGELFEGSLSSPSELSGAFEGVDVVYHLAASMKGAPADMFLATVVGSKNLLEAMVAAGSRARVVLVSSFAVYGVAGMRRGSRLDETAPLEPHPELRDPYAQVKLRQERLFREYAERHGLPLVVVRPGVIYGPWGPPLSSRVGLRLPGLLLHIGGSTLLPITQVDNCAAAIALAGTSPEAVGRVVNVLDDELISARRYLSLYKRNVQPVRSLLVPYTAVRVLSHLVEWYHRHSKGQLPAVITPYRTAATWKPMRFDNSGLRRLGWKPVVSTPDGLREAFAGFRERLAAGERLP
jgi:nucleoside-diphosphate-sugar epimerase